MKLSLPRALLSIAPLLAVSTTVRAQVVTPSVEAESIVVLDDYLVETNPATYNQKAPAVTHQMLGPDLAALNLPETGDALQHLPNLFIRKRFVGDKNALTSIRGTSNRQPGRTLVLADGIALSNFLGTGFGNSPRWFLIAPDEIEKIAVSYGPYSSLYAGNSIGGTVLFTTKLPAAFHASARTQLLFQDFSEYGTDEIFRGETAHVSIGDRRGKFSYFAFYNRVANDSHPMSFNTINVSQTADPGIGAARAGGSIAENNFSGAPWIVYGSSGPTETIHDLFKLKLAYDIGDALHLRYTVAYWTNEENVLQPETYLRDVSGAPIWDGTVETSGRTFTIPGNAFTLSERRQADMIHGFTLAHDPAHGLQFTVTGSIYDVMRDKQWASNGSAPDASEGGAGRATLIGATGWKTADALFGWRELEGPLATHSPVAGFHYDIYFTGQEQRNISDWRDRSSLTTLISGNGGKTTTHAFFLQDTWRVSDRWTVTPGLRYERWRAADGYESSAAVRGVYDDRSDAAWSPKLALSWKPAPEWSARLSIARATRFPTVGELFQGSVSTSGSVNQSNPDLRPERAHATDLTIERLLAGGSIRISLFEEDVRDALVNQSTRREDGSTLSGPQNVGRVLTHGVELALQQKRFLHESIDLDFNVSYTNAVIKENAPILIGGALVDTVGSQFPRIPRWQVKSLFNWRATGSLSLSAASRYSSYQYNTLENSDPHGGFGGTDAFFTIDVRAVWRARERYTASLGCDNINDDRYHVYHTMPGRTWVAEIKWSY